MEQFNFSQLLKLTFDGDTTPEDLCVLLPSLFALLTRCCVLRAACRMKAGSLEYYNQEIDRLVPRTPKPLEHIEGRTLQGTRRGCCMRFLVC